MEVCPTCKKEIETIKLLKCKFCDKNFCSLGCLIKHASTHLGNNDSSINLVNSLKRRQSENLTEQYAFITSGDFKEKINFDEKYAYENFTKVIEDIFPKQLGRGSFGRVYLVSHNNTKKLFVGIPKLKALSSAFSSQSTSCSHRLITELTLGSSIFFFPFGKKYL